MRFRCLVLLAFAGVSFLPLLPSQTQLLALSTVSLLFFLFLFLGAACSQRLILVKTLVLLCCTLWALLWGQMQLEQRLSPALESVDIRIEGVIIAASDSAAGDQRLRVSVNRAFDELGQRLYEFPSLIRLRRNLISRYPESEQWTGAEESESQERWQQGQGWSFWVRLKRPRGFSNPAGFDYERWLLARGIGAMGYIKTTPKHQAERRVDLDRMVLSWAGAVKQRLSSQLGDGQSTSTLLALAFGDRSGLSRDDQQLLQRAGLSHLLAISGLHVGLAAMFGAYVGRYLGFVFVGWRPLRWFGPIIGLWVGVVFAIAYAAVAGFSLATQRALVMLLVAAIWLSSYRYYSPWLAWWWAMFAVLVLQPLSLLEASFWFSFVAVAVLMLVLSWRVTSRFGRLWLIIKAQCCLFICLTCLQWFLGTSVSVWSPLANILAIPYVSLLVVPQVLLALVLSVFDWELSQYLWHGVHACLEFFWWLLRACQSWIDESVLPLPNPLSIVALAIIFMALMILILPFGGATRGLALMLIVTVLAAGQPQDMRSKLYVLDVGQGLAVVAVSEGRALIYDLGPRFSAQFNTGVAVVAPFLSSIGVSEVELGVISHWDSDHTGGVMALNELMGVKQWLVSDAGSTEASDLGEGVEDCRSSSERHIGGWRISVLGYATAQGQKIKTYPKRNNRSCVLLLESKGLRVLLPGDIERLREMELLSHPQLQQPIDIMIAPHHGSGTSSSAAWVAQLQPHTIVYSSGYRNRYRHPQAAVRQRYRRAGSTEWMTSRDGAITIEQDRDGAWRAIGYRQSDRRYWR